MRALRFGAVASASEAMVTESMTDGNPQVDADESSRRRLDRTWTTVLEPQLINSLPAEDSCTIA
jgi:hypothetical protein